MVNNRSTLFPALLLPLLVGCVADPEVIGPLPAVGDSLHGVVVVNEGLWRQDNSTLTFYDPATVTATQDYFALKNPGLRLGDTGNDIVIRGDRAYVTMTTSQNIEVMELPSMRSFGRVRITDGGDPRETVIVNDSLGFATLVLDDAVVAFDSRTLTPAGRIPVGPAPEGIASDGERLFVANSGYAYLRQSEPKAGTISVIDVASRHETGTLDVGPNVVDVCIAGGSLYALYGMPHPDSAGGVVEYDLTSLKERRGWRIFGAGVAGEMAFDNAAGLLYVIGRDGVMRVDLGQPAVGATLFAPSAEWTSLGFYGLGVEPTTGDIYVSYTRNFTTPGEALIYNRDGTVADRFPCGLNPGAFGFY